MPVRPHARMKRGQTARTFTQTFSTATLTHANTTYAAPSGGATQDAESRASLAQLAADVANLKQVVNSLIDLLQEQGIAR